MKANRITFDRIRKSAFKKPIYDVWLWNGNNIMARNQLNEIQSNGWEIAGDITPTPRINKHSDDRMLIAFKRLRK
jgi:hypothetical protein